MVVDVKNILDWPYQLFTYFKSFGHGLDGGRCHNGPRVPFHCNCHLLHGSLTNQGIVNKKIVNIVIVNIASITS